MPSHGTAGNLEAVAERPVVWLDAASQGGDQRYARDARNIAWALQAGWYRAVHDLVEDDRS